MKRTKASKAPKKSAYVLKRERAQKQLAKIGTMLKKLILITQGETFTIDEFGKVLGIARAVDALKHAVSTRTSRPCGT
jgi:hypothetical protein